MSDHFARIVEVWLAQPAVERIGWALAHFLWQGAVVAALLVALRRATPRAAPSARYWTACAALLVMAACPIATLAWSWSAPPRGAEAVAMPLVEETANVPGSNLASSEAIPQPPPIPSGPSAAQAPAHDIKPSPAPSRALSIRESMSLARPALAWLAAFWLAGVLLLTLRLGIGWLGVQRMRRRGTRPAPQPWEGAISRLARQMRVSRPVRLLESALVEAPTLIGWLAPVILLPASAWTGLPPRQLEALLAHELAHVRRHDYLVNLVQTALETLLFYHPAVWWVSRTIRAEREACCDEVAAQVCGDRLEYAQALASMESLRLRQRQLALAADGGPLLDRIRRVVGDPAPQSNREAWWIMAAAAGVALMLALPGSRRVEANGPDDPPPRPSEGEWGPASNGLQSRLTAVAPEVDDESPDMAKAVDKFARGEEVALKVELKNVSDKPVTLLGVRYGQSYPTAAGRLATEAFAPHLFDLEFMDPSGKPISRPKREFVGPDLRLSGASTHTLEPGQSLAIILRPAKLNSPMDHHLPPGEYQAQVRYHVAQATVENIRKHWPDKPQASAWTGEVTSNRATFAVAEDPQAPAPVALRWGEPNEGLRAAVELRLPGGAPLPSDGSQAVPLNTKLDVVFHLQNVGDKPISLVSETWRQDDRATVKDESGKEQTLGGAWYSGVPTMIRWTLKPQETAQVQAANLAVAADEQAAQRFEHPVGKTLIANPGVYRLTYTIRLGSIQSRDGEGNLIFPTEADWTGELTTAEMPLAVRARTPQDDAAERAGRFLGRIEVVGKEEGKVDGGVMTVRGAGQSREPQEIEIRAGQAAIPDCSLRPLTIALRVPGYEEAVFHYVDLKPDVVKRLTLTPAAPARLRLVSAVDGRPVAGAKVRYFNKTSDKAGAGPYPTSGLEGPVWAESQADGTAALDTLQKTDPYYENLGDAVYSFYIEAPGYAGRFLGGVKAGAELGDLELSPPLQVRGEVHGTPEQLGNFAAEWDQPFEMKTAKATSVYAVSQRLQTERDGDKLTFHLSGLRPGPLRFVSNFGPRPHSVSHTYGRRDPSESDVVVQIDLEKSLEGLVLTPEGHKRTDP